MKIANIVRVAGAAALLATAALATVSSAAPPDQTPGQRTAAQPVQARKLNPSARASAGRSPSSRLARTDATLLDRDDAQVIPVLVKLDHDSVAGYQGDVSGYAATSPAVTGRRLAGDQAQRAYEGYLAQREQRFAGALTKALPSAQIRQRLRTVYGGVGVTVPANQVKKLLAIDGVVAVQRDELRRRLTDSSSDFIGADVVQRQLGGSKRGERNAGKGVIVGILDTGAWPEHPSLADQGNLSAPPARSDGSARACDFGDNPLTPARDVFRCNHKLIGGAAFLDSYLAAHPDETYSTARDSNGHGTHTGSTAAGNVLESAAVFGVERGPVRGVAPGAWVSVYKVCGGSGCMSSDSAAAIAQAVEDGVDVINFSISGGTDPFTDPVEMAFLDAYAAGVFVAASAGNSGPGVGTVNHLSPWVTTVAASTQTREFAASVTLRAGGQESTLRGVSITAGTGDAPVILASDGPSYDGGVRCEKPAAAGTFTGKIVVCERGVNPRVDKGWNVLQGGAIGMILHNPTLQDVETDNHWLPTVHLADNAVLTFLRQHSGVTGTLSAGVAQRGAGDVLAAFSSRGPGGLALKPDVTAPGVQILAGHTPTPDEKSGGPDGELFQAIAGTSMSAPHVAGAAALLVAAHPGWTPGQTKSALMTSAGTDVRKEDLVTAADPLDLGAGRIAVDRAVNPGLTIAESASRMLRLADDEVDAVHLNLPSVNAPVMPGRLTTTRVVRNVSGQTRTWTSSASAPADSAISVEPASLTLPPNGEATIKINIASRSTAEAYLFGEVRLVPARGGVAAVHLPVAFRPGQGQVQLAGVCAAPTVQVGQVVDCSVSASNVGYDDAEVNIKTILDHGVRLDAVHGARRTEPDQVSQQATLRGIEPAVPALSEVDGRRWHPLSTEGITADPIGDEEILNYDVPEFSYAGQRFTRLGVVSNGYLVVGGGTVKDVRHEPPAGVEPARPDNILAPYWADLDGSADDGIRAATVTDDGGQEWIVIEWRVKPFGTAEHQHFQVWIAAGQKEGIRFAYDDAALPAGAKAFAIGAENAQGKGELRTVAPGADLVVATAGGRPGDQLSYTLTLRGVSPATDVLKTVMTSPDVPGTTVVRTHLTVTPSP